MQSKARKSKSKAQKETVLSDIVVAVKGDSRHFLKIKNRYGKYHMGR